MTDQRYTSPEAFRQALEQRLRNRHPSGAASHRARQVLIFHRFVARLNAEFDDRLIIKGGLVLELRLGKARMTKDVDLRFAGSSDRILQQLQSAGRRDLGDFMTFEISPDEDHPIIRNDGMRYEGYRMRATCRLAGRTLGQPFGVDVAVGDPVIGEPDVAVAEDLLSFAGIEPPTLRLYPVVTHIAEKVHAYTLPRQHLNSRIKDLPDIALLATVGPINARDLRLALVTTFEFRGTHEIPDRLPDPPEAWRERYAAMSASDELDWKTLDDVIAVARSFLDPVLLRSIDATWDPMVQVWRRK